MWGGSGSTWRLELLLGGLINDPLGSSGHSRSVLLGGRRTWALDSLVLPEAAEAEIGVTNGVTAKSARVGGARLFVLVAGLLVLRVPTVAIAIHDGEAAELLPLSTAAKAAVGVRVRVGTGRVKNARETVAAARTRIWNRVMFDVVGSGGVRIEDPPACLRHPFLGFFLRLFTVGTERAIG